MPGCLTNLSFTRELSMKFDSSTIISTDESQIMLNQILAMKKIITAMENLECFDLDLHTVLRRRGSDWEVSHAIGVLNDEMFTVVREIRKKMDVRPFT